MPHSQDDNPYTPMTCCFCASEITALDPSEKTLSKISSRIGVKIEGRVCSKCLLKFNGPPRSRSKHRAPASMVGKRALASLIKKDYRTFVSCVEEIEIEMREADRRVEKALNEVESLVAARNSVFAFRNQVQHAMHNSPVGKYLVRRLEANAKIADPALRLRIMSRDKFRCLKCSASDGLSIDHIKPVIKGGSDDDLNLQTLCRSCNSSKGSSIEFARPNVS